MPNLTVNTDLPYLTTTSLTPLSQMASNVYNNNLEVENQLFDTHFHGATGGWYSLCIDSIVDVVRERAVPDIANYAVNTLLITKNEVLSYFSVPRILEMLCAIQSFEIIHFIDYLGQVPIIQKFYELLSRPIVEVFQKTISENYNLGTCYQDKEDLLLPIAMVQEQTVVLRALAESVKYCLTVGLDNCHEFEYEEMTLVNPFQMPTFSLQQNTTVFRSSNFNQINYSDQNLYSPEKF